MVRGEGTASIEGPASIEGDGIGLATCRRIVAAHGGRIGVTDSQEGGADFWFELPLAPADTPVSAGSVEPSGA